MPEDHEHHTMTACIWEASKHANACLRKMYGTGLWMSPAKARTLAGHGLEFLRCFQDLAAGFYELHLPRFQLVSKLHMWAHVCYDLLRDAERGEVMNPLSASCQMDEDFVGRVCSISRATHGRTVHSKTLQKYKINLAVRW